MTQIKKLKNSQGTEFYPRTHTKAVVDDNGYTAESRLQAMQDEINAAQLEIGAVPSDLTPTSGSTNWVTSGGIYNFEPLTNATIEVSTDSMDKVSCNLGANTKWSTDNGATHVVIPCNPGDVFSLSVTSTQADGNWQGWLTSEYTTPTNGMTIPYVSGTGRTWRYTGSVMELTAPQGTAYICLGTKDGSGRASSWSGTLLTKVKLIDVVNTKIGETELNQAMEQVNSDIEKSKSYLETYPVTWESTNTSIINATESNGDVVVNVISKTVNQHVGFSIANVKVGEKILIDFSSTNAPTSPSAGFVIAWGETIGDTTYHHIADTRQSVYFTKTSASQKYIYTPANSYNSNTTFTLYDFAVYKVYSMDYVVKNLNSIESYAFMPSSYIPIKEGYENYMSISGGQGSTVYGNFFVQGYSYTNKTIRIYDLTSKQLVQSVDLPTFANTRYHANTISFSGTKYDNGDDFPLLYICSGYTDTSSVSTSEVYVVRIIGTSGSYTTSLIQTITLDFGVVNNWTEFVVDPINSRAWISRDGSNTNICVALPSISSSSVTINNETTIIDKFDTKAFTLGTSTKSSKQGRFFYHNRIYYVSGVPSYSGEGPDALYIVVNNTLTHCTEAVVPLKNFGLVSGTSNTYEPEGCFIWNDDFYVAYSTFIAKIIQN